MELSAYLERPGAETIDELFTRMVGLGSTIKSTKQIYQWAYVEGRRPGIPNARILHQATNGLVAVWDIYPDNWAVCFPDMVRRKGAPPIQQPAKRAA